MFPDHAALSYVLALYAIKNVLFKRELILLNRAY